MTIRDVNDSMNIIALVVIAMGVAISIRQPSTGHDLIIGGLGCIGGSTGRTTLTRLTSEPPSTPADSTIPQ
jgi:hypothetical protein